MEKKHYTDEQIAYTLRQVEAGTRVVELCRRMGVSQETFCTWRRKYADMGVAELRELRQFRQENRKLKPLVADPRDVSRFPWKIEWMHIPGVRSIGSTVFAAF